MAQAHKMKDGQHTIARLRHLITQRDLAERVHSIGVSLENNEDGNPTIVVACPLLEDEAVASPGVVLRMTEAVGAVFTEAYLRFSEVKAERDALRAKVKGCLDAIAHEKDGPECSYADTVERIAAVLSQPDET